MVTTEVKTGTTATATATSVKAITSTSTATNKTSVTSTAAASASIGAKVPNVPQGVPNVPLGVPNVPQGVPNVPQGVQIVQLTNKQTYHLDEAALERILLRDDIKDLHVVVVSVAGAFRGGKSFLLNYFLRYLNAPESSRNESGQWWGAEDESLQGFSWCGGSTRHTTGIVMWSNPIISTLPSGEKVAILLMDTQGTFDNRSSMRDCSTIFALSTLLSSVQIYNISNNLKEDDLQHLQFFTEYGKLLKTEDGDKAFQELMFLIRDWQYDYEAPFGRSGGQQVLENNLKILDEQPREMRELRKHIRSCFESISCYLMPYPGRNVRNPNFDGRISALDDEFIAALIDLIPSIFSKTKLIPKQINGDRVRARDLLTYIKSYMNIFNSDKMPAPKTIMKATSEAAMLLGIREARTLYESIMDAKCGPNQPSWPKAVLKDVHNSASEEARRCFRSKKMMGSKKDSDAYLAQLNKDLETRVTEFMMMNENKVAKAIAEAKEKYQAHMNAVHGEDMLCLHPDDLDSVHVEAVLEATKVFDSKRKQNLNCSDEERTAFLENFNKELLARRCTNDVNNRLIVSEIRTNYSTIMSRLCTKQPPLDENEFLEEHKKALANAIETLDRKRNLTSVHDEDAYKTDMSKKILESYTQMSCINRSKNRKALQEALDYYESYMTRYWDPKTCCLHPADLETAHDTAKRQALQMFHPNQDEDETDFEKMLISKIMDFKHRDLKDLNNSANESAVTVAYNVYYSGMESDCAPSGWWFLVVPLLVHLSKKSEYHNNNKEAAFDVFYGKRRDKRNKSYDKYYEDLDQKIENVYESTF